MASSKFSFYLILLILISEASHSLSGSSKHLGFCRDGPITTILTIDGGGVRGIIPSVILRFLEEELQRLDGEDARLADYFDLMGGTSTGALIVSMLSSPDSTRDRHPMFTAKGILDFYFQESPNIFTERSAPQNLILHTASPKYDGVHLRKTVQSLLQDLRVGDALTNILVPAFDIRAVQPIIFSSFKAHDPLMNVKLSDLCLGTTAAPTYFPPHFFRMQQDRNSLEFHLVDGGVIANNPTLLTLLEAQKFMPGSSSQRRKFVVLSLGTGVANRTGTYDAREMAGWGRWGWVWNGASNLVIANQQLVDEYYLKEMLTMSNADVQILRVQEHNLGKTEAEMDKSTTKNMRSLADVGTRLLDQQAEGNAVGITNKIALKTLASVLQRRRGKACKSD